jgi:type II secretory pathway pseudopilin PulG
LVLAVVAFFVVPGAVAAAQLLFDTQLFSEPPASPDCSRLSWHLAERNFAGFVAALRLAFEQLAIIATASIRYATYNTFRPCARLLACTAKPFAAYLVHVSRCPALASCSPSGQEHESAQCPDGYRVVPPSLLTSGAISASRAMVAFAGSLENSFLLPVSAHAHGHGQTLATDRLVPLPSWAAHTCVPDRRLLRLADAVWHAANRDLIRSSRAKLCSALVFPGRSASSSSSAAASSIPVSERTAGQHLPDLASPLADLASAAANKAGVEADDVTAIVALLVAEASHFLPNATSNPTPEAAARFNDGTIAVTLDDSNDICVTPLNIKPANICTLIHLARGWVANDPATVAIASCLSVAVLIVSSCAVSRLRERSLAAAGASDAKELLQDYRRDVGESLPLHQLRDLLFPPPQSKQQTRIWSRIVNLLSQDSRVEFSDAVAPSGLLRRVIAWEGPVESDVIPSGASAGEAATDASLTPRRRSFVPLPPSGSASGISAPDRAIGSPVGPLVLGAAKGSLGVYPELDD